MVVRGIVRNSGGRKEEVNTFQHVSRRRHKVSRHEECRNFRRIVVNLKFVRKEIKLMDGSKKKIENFGLEKNRQIE